MTSKEAFAVYSSLVVRDNILVSMGNGLCRN